LKIHVYNRVKTDKYFGFTFNFKIKTMENKTCQHCNKIIKGRTDKKFCDDYCRNIFNNQLKYTTNNLVRNTNNILGKNRRIIESYFEEGINYIKIKKEILIDNGFLFSYNTKSKKLSKGAYIYYCYEYAFLPISEEYYILMKDE
jgi:predicted nucleic acid-binding Zn ribbon protein